MNLIKADLMKLWKDKPFKIILIVMLALNFFTLMMFKIMQVMLPEASQSFQQLGEMTFYSLFALGNLGLYVALAAGMFVGKDFSYNTLRNKIIAGNSRIKIYCSTLIVNLIIGAIFYLFTLIEGGLVGLIVFGKFSDFGRMAQIVTLCAVIYLGMVSLITFVCMVTRSQMLSIVFNVLIIIVLPSIVSILAMVNQSVLQSDILSAVLGATPFGIMNDLTGGMMAVGGEAVKLGGAIWLKTVLSTLVLSGACFGGGVALFQNADIK